jgi:predicted N-acetyltransferase YhbS
VIFGDPGYYKRFGFQPCDSFGITTADGRNFDAFMAVELSPGSMKGVKGKFYAAETFQNLPKAEVEKYNKKFPPLRKLKFPGQMG